MKILLDLMVSVDAQLEFDPDELDVADETWLSADDVIASLRATSRDKITAAIDVGILAPDLCKIYVQVLDDGNRVTSRGEW